MFDFPSEMTKRIQQINSLRPYDSQKQSANSKQETAAERVQRLENIGIANNLMIEQVIKNQNKIMQRLDIEA